ncbi:roadblock/LC7 domain-containing protein [Streptomyces albus subsp. chlorinus]|uniref:roadblock/LC7 domain-containing protein n=1 Tax=Streptomyces albus TaxID=1888 RepID=UPI00157008BD|nr:roadblock/LC7 domain-containing protein [Streptomyces albus]NSC24814.1 roadblock/LC7 domain-containing protein [Streptomyces albus subsp. chlorinus]
MVSEALAQQHRTEEETALSVLLAGLVRRVPHAAGAVLFSADGLVKAAYGLDPDTADPLAALASGLYSLARGFGTRMAGGDGVRQVVVELDRSLLCVARADPDMCLAALARREADAAVLAHEMGVLAERVRPLPPAPAWPSGAR